jgi:sterol 14alpha-demethylase
MGEQFAYVQIKTIVSVLLRQFELTPVSKELPKPNYKAMVAGPLAETTLVRYRRREVPL